MQNRMHRPLKRDQEVKHQQQQDHRFFVVRPSEHHERSLTMVNGPHRELEDAQKAMTSRLNNRGRVIEGPTAIWKFTFGLKPEFIEGDRW